MYCQNFVKNRLTIGIKTFCRPKTLEENLYTIFNKNKIRYPIIIADDSLLKYKKENIKIINKYKKNFRANIQIIDLKVDSGLSKGRNEIVNKCNTEYIMILDDSRSFTSDLDINKMIRFLDENEEYHLFCGVITQRGGIHSKYAFIFNSYKLINNITHIDVASPKKIDNKLFKSLEETNIGVNVFIARNKCLKLSPWNNKLKVGEHEEFFFNFYKKGYKCVISSDCNFIQLINRTYPEDLNKYRLRSFPGGEYDINRRIVFIKNFAKKEVKHNIPNIYYINLLHRKDRKEFLLKDLKNISYTNNRIHRIDAIKHNIGAIGCLASHIKALKIGLNENYKCEYVIILEDDFAIRNISITKTYLNKIFTEQLDWNVILLGVNGRCHKNSDLFLKKIIWSQTTSGYIIKKKYIPILLKLWEDIYNKIKNFQKNPTLMDHADQCWKQLQHDRWFTTEPVLGYQHESYSDIEQRVTNYGN